MAAEVGKSVWDLEEGEVRRPGIVHVVMCALFTGIGIVVGTFGSLAVPIGFVSLFWPGQAVQVIGGIWFGWWGGIAGFLFPLISNLLSGAAPLAISLAYAPSNLLLQPMLGAWAFRFFKADPRLRSGRDWGVWVVFGVILANLGGALWGSLILLWFGMITGPAYWTTVVGWASGNTVPSLILGSVILYFVSPLVMRTAAFCKGYWA